MVASSSLMHVVSEGEAVMMYNGARPWSGQGGGECVVRGAVWKKLAFLALKSRM